MMLFAPLASASLCTSLYSDCPTCISHYSDRQCGWQNATGQCLASNESTGSAFLYGPSASCFGPAVPSPTAAPPAPSAGPFPATECAFFSDCESCTVHWGDRQCGWCAASSACTAYTGATTACDLSQFYSKGTAACGAPVPPPDPTPWPRYQKNATFCYSLTNSNCQKCVNTNASLYCGWCRETKECIMGDALGPFFGTCGEWSIPANDASMSKCSAGLSVGATVGLSVGIPVAVIIIVVVVVCVVCRRARRRGAAGYSADLSLTGRTDM
jgi:hypothetical protein